MPTPRSICHHYTAVTITHKPRQPTPECPRHPHHARPFNPVSPLHLTSQQISNHNSQAVIAQPAERRTTSPKVAVQSRLTAPSDITTDQQPQLTSGDSSTCRASDHQSEGGGSIPSHRSILSGSAHLLQFYDKLLNRSPLL